MRSIESSKKALLCTHVQLLMGTGWSWFPRISSSTRIESDAFEVMAEGKPRHSQARISQDDIRRYTHAFQVVQEFLNNSESMIDRQRILESDLETCQERYVVY